MKGFLGYISKMTLNLDKNGLKSISEDYDLYFIDLWGVIHNGVSLFKNSIEVLNQLELKNKKYVLLTNAPRPNSTVKEFLVKMGLDKKFMVNIHTSGEASLNYLKTKFKDKKFFHVGPPRDFDLFKEFKFNKVETLEESEFIICTGLFENENINLNYYKDLLDKFTDRIMICTNPDLIVDRGKIREFCAGSVAKIFENINGKVEYFGKPYSNVYNHSLSHDKKRVLCIGDNLNTDIKGANLQNFKSLLITNGIHKSEFNKHNSVEIFNKYDSRPDYIQSDLKW